MLATHLMPTNSQCSPIINQLVKNHKNQSRMYTFKLKRQSRTSIIGLAMAMSLWTSSALYSQDYFEFKNPSFSFSVPNGWKENPSNNSMLLFGKYVKVNDGIIGGILRVGRDVYFTKLGTIWNLSEETEKNQLEKEAKLFNFTFKKDILNDHKIVKISFETVIEKDNNSKHFKAVIYKMLVLQDNQECVINFFLITSPKDFENDHRDLLQILATLNTSSQKTIFNSQKEVLFNQKRYLISKPVDYDYFSNSIFNYLNINQFTQTYCFTNDLSIYDFELLVPKNINNQPTIHFYTSNALVNQSITPQQFMETKTFWKKMYEQPNFEKLLNYIISDSLLFCKFEFSNTKSMTFTHLKDETNLLSTLVFMNIKTDVGIMTNISITNHIYINNIVVFIKLSQTFKTFSDIDKIKKISDMTVSEFLKNNQR